jgi:hypothetical protein
MLAAQYVIELAYSAFTDAEQLTDYCRMYTLECRLCVLVKIH